MLVNIMNTHTTSIPTTRILLLISKKASQLQAHGTNRDTHLARIPGFIHQSPTPLLLPRRSIQWCLFDFAYLLPKEALSFSNFSSSDLGSGYQRPVLQYEHICGLSLQCTCTSTSPRS